MRRTQFPRLVIPLAVVLTGLFNLGVNLVVVFVFILVAGVDPMWTWVLLPLVIVALTVFTTAVSMIVSALNPRFRDTGIIWTVAVTALFYATPVLYPIEIVPGTVRAAAGAQPAGAAVRAGAQVGDRPGRAGPGRGRRRRGVAARRRPRSSSRSARWRCGSSTARRRGSPRSSEHPRPLSEEAERRHDQDRRDLSGDLGQRGHLDEERE